MDWAGVIQFSTGCLAAIGAWFLYDLVREFKGFKKETGRDIESLKRERDAFQQMVRGAEISMKARVIELNSALETSKTHIERNLGIIDNELARIRYSIERVNDKAKKFDEFMDVSFRLAQAIHERNKSLQKQINEIKGTVTKN